MYSLLLFWLFVEHFCDLNTGPHDRQLLYKRFSLFFHFFVMMLSSSRFLYDHVLAANIQKKWRKSCSNIAQRQCILIQFSCKCRSFTRVLHSFFYKRRYDSISKRGEDREPVTFKVGDSYEGFDCVKIRPVPELNLTAYQFIHKNTKADYIHLDTADRDNVFR